MLPEGEQPGWQFFDATGHELTEESVENPEPVAPGEGEPAGEVVDEQALLLRIGRALGYMQAMLDRKPELGQVAPGHVVTETPHPQGTLAEVLQRLAREFGPMNPETMPNRGGWLHLRPAAGVAHR